MENGERSEGVVVLEGAGHDSVGSTGEMRIGEKCSTVASDCAAVAEGGECCVAVLLYDGLLFRTGEMIAAGKGRELVCLASSSLRMIWYSTAS